MEKELIQNPDLKVDFYAWQTGTPLFSHFEVEHFPPLKTSDDPIINELIGSGYQVHESISSFWCGIPRFEGYLSHHYVANERREYQIDLEGDGFLRWRYQRPGEIYLSLFHIFPAHQNQGRARYWFPKLCDDFFCAGAKSLRGIVAPSYYERETRMDRAKLTRFYVRQGFTAYRNGWIEKNSPYLAKPEPVNAQSSP